MQYQREMNILLQLISDKNVYPGRTLSADAGDFDGEGLQGV